MFDFQSKNITVAGLGRFGGGIAVTRWLAAQGANVVSGGLGSTGFGSGLGTGAGNDRG